MGDASNINNDMPHSATLSHVANYPVVSDTVSTIKSNPYGAKAIEITDNGYASFVKPALGYLETPASYVAPYAKKADELGDHFLKKFDEQVPIVRSNTEEIKGTAYDYATWPFVTANNGKNWIFSTWNKETEKCGGPGIIPSAKGGASTSLIALSNVLTWMSEQLAHKKEQAKQIANENRTDGNATKSSSIGQSTTISN